MQMNHCPNPRNWPKRPSRTWLRTFSGAVVFVAIAIVMMFGHAAPAPQAPSMDKPYLMPQANRLPDKNEQMQMHEQQDKKRNYEAVNAARKKQIAEDAARLLQLATELKAEVDKTNKDTLSLNVIRKADTIERLAKGVKEKMKLTIGGS